ncbi:hypothetical protein [uncultured Tenacibaculum sp.]|uniref:hypothetical protein n=1 Tax=uncultured Tenacibaculum sp. TaxID=174713 RepID=UPI0026324A8F|nr:hypothetical protein [uncultured Tenacibaculum sp.]
MRNLKFMLCIVVFVFTVSCTDNTEDLVTNTPTINATINDTTIDGIDLPIDKDPKDGTGSGNDYTGEDGSDDGDGGKSN